MTRRRAVILGGTGVVGRAIARMLLADGWSVDLVARNPSAVPNDLNAAGATFHRSMRRDIASLAAVLSTGADLLVDCLCFTANYAEQLKTLSAQAHSTVMISSKAVYVDRMGNHVNSVSAPQFDGPIDESHPTLAPSMSGNLAGSGYGANKVAAEQVLMTSGYPVTVLRASKVHGDGGTRPREWVWVKRVLDHRPVAIFNFGGQGADLPTAATNLAALVGVIADKPGSRILNIADPDTPTGLEIARVVADHLGHRWEECFVEPGVELGNHPWNCWPPIRLSTEAASSLGYRPVGDYASSVVSTLDWLASCDGRLFDSEFFKRYFNYAAEDRYLARR